MLPTKYEYIYYLRLAKKNINFNILGNYIEESARQDAELQRLIREEASENPLFDPNTVIKPDEPMPPEERERIKAQTDLYFAQRNPFNSTNNVPKCPTCGSVQVKKISTTAKVASGAMFGLFSKTARSQFQCLNCNYKW